MKLFFQKIYYQRFSWLAWLLWPLAWIYLVVITLRKKCYQAHLLKSTQFQVPVIIVGNITLGGTGKTPLVIAIVHWLQAQGFHPGIISRGYGGKAVGFPKQVGLNDLTEEVGDEPFLLARNSNCPVVIDPKRPRGVEYLLQTFPNVDVVVSDDGLQHYALARQIEIALIDGQAQFGNGFLFPAGPLRELRSRLKQVDFVLINQGKEPFDCGSITYKMSIEATALVHLSSGKEYSIDEFKDQPVHGVCAIGNPTRFFDTLQPLVGSFSTTVFSDHYIFREKDLAFNDDYPIIMTEKDAVKCNLFKNPKLYYLKIAALIEHEFKTQLLTKLASISSAKFLKESL